MEKKENDLNQTSMSIMFHFNLQGCSPKKEVIELPIIDFTEPNFLFSFREGHRIFFFHP